MKKIVVAGNKSDHVLFSLIGAKTIELKKNEDLSRVVAYLESNRDSVAGLVLAAKYFDESSRQYAKVQRMGIPVIMLPDPESNFVDTSLEKLQEKTIGMKLKN